MNNNYQETVFDIEVFPKWWCIVYSNPNDSSILEVIRSDKKDCLLEIKKLVYKRVLYGFNIKNYDLRILNAILDRHDPDFIYKVSKSIIDNDDTFPYNNYNFWNKFLFSDLYDDWRFGSLKEFESNIGMSIKESSISFDTVDLSEDDKEEIIKYCKHDVAATVKLKEFRKEYINSKKMLSEMFKIPIFKALKSTNAKLCAIILKAKPIDRLPDNKFVIPENVKPYIYENLPYNVIELFNEFSSETKTVELFDNVINFGIGGIHSTYCDNLISKTDSQCVLVKIDVRSYYPNLMMLFDYMSRNVADPTIYRDIYNLRIKLKADMREEEKLNGKSAKWYILNDQQTALKLILNTTYGAIKNKYNALYDEYQASSLCYLGQLLLASLSNKIFNNTNSIIIQTNTDGLIVKVLRDEYDKVKEIVSEWEKMTGFVMEYDTIKMFFQRDVNNYIEVTDNPKKPYELKGKWANQAEETIANLNAPVTHEAILNYYTKNIPVEKTIYECQEPIKFCFTTKTGYTYLKTMYCTDYTEVEINKVNRVMASTNKSLGTIKKYKLEEKIDDNGDISYKPRYDKIGEIPDNCIIMNDELYIPNDLDRDWYVKFAKDKIKSLRWV